MLRLWSLEEIRSMMGSAEPVEGCLVVEVNLQPMQVAFTNERPSDDMKYFQYDYDPHDTSCIPLFTQNQFPVYGVIIGSVRGGIPLAILTPARGAKFGVASFRDGQDRFHLLVHEAAHAAFRNRCYIEQVGGVDNDQFVCLYEGDEYPEYQAFDGSVFDPRRLLAVYPASEWLERAERGEFDEEGEG